MSNRRSFAQRLALAFVVTALGACSDDTMTAFPEEDASDQDAPSFDIPATDTGTDTGTTDRGTVTDRPPPRDNGGAETSICPASCAASAECDPCRTPDTPSTVQYCCISGLCVSMTGTCPTLTDGGPGDSGGDAAADGAADGSPGDDVPDPTDDMPDEDTGSPPDDVAPASDLGGDGSSTDGSAADGSAADASVDATASMDAAADGNG